MSYKTRRRLSLLVLVLGIPAYIVVAVSAIAQFERPNLLTEFMVYLILGIVWALPLRAVFRGVGRADPEDEG